MSNATWLCPTCGQTGVMEAESVNTNPHVSDHETQPIFVYYEGVKDGA